MSSKKETEIIKPIYIHKIAIKNFRLLKEVELYLEERTILIVGRNNSGKTSLTELFRRLSADKLPTFRLEDFSLPVYDQFWTAFNIKRKGNEEDKVREALPIIQVKLTIKYDKSAPSLGPLGDFIIDLNLDCTEALIVIRYQLKEGEIKTFFEDIDFDENASEDQKKAAFFQIIKDRLPDRYKGSVYSEDPNDSTNRKQLEWFKFQNLMHSCFINAQRGLDDITDRDRDVLGKILETLFTKAKSDSATEKDRLIAQHLEDEVKKIQVDIGKNFNKQLDVLLPAFTLFGYPGLSDPNLLTETKLDVKRLLTNHTKVHYAGVNGINLPEAYNGLGARNLIFILLKLLEFFKAYTVTQPAPGIHIVFIEEPEVHLHPQMQEVFIRKIGEITDVFANEFNNGEPWPVQFVVTTHSTHMSNEAPFDSLRYFLSTPIEQDSTIHTTHIKDLREGLGGSKKEDREFLHKYMTLTRCDLLFADKAILIEGTTERLLLPKMIEKIDADLPKKSPKLSSQYISVVEVGGAYAHIFFPLVDFLELSTLIITDLDSVKENDEGNSIKCKVSEGTHTSNACIKTWFDDKKNSLSPAELLQKSEEVKTCGIRRLAYQVPEEKVYACGRSFEETFILANPQLFPINGNSEQEREDEAWSKAKSVKKSDFALKYAIEETGWVVPRYIAEGLRWLAKNPHHKSEDSHE
jgi:predicted ATP-dependent endonuclease of OLD family